MKLTKHKMVSGKLALLVTAIFILFAALPAIAFANTLIHNSSTLGSTKHGGSWGVSGGKYGEFTCGTCHARKTGNIKRVKKKIVAPGPDTFPVEANPTYNVAFLDVRNGSSDFGDDAAASRPGGLATTSEKVCEVCHTYDAAKSVGVEFHGYDMSGAGNPGHYNNKDCTVCHPHNQGFKPLDCTACHGFPPETNDNNGSTTTGLAYNPFTTGSVTAGAHIVHANDMNYACENCHSGYSMPQNSTVPGYETQGDISISFSNFGSTTGSYSGQADVSYDDVLGDGSVTCSTIYCHGSTLNGSSPTWTGAVNCGDCHLDTNAAMDNAAALGSHQQHAGDNTGAGQLNLACSKCHASPGAVDHVTGTVAWDLDRTDAKFGDLAAYDGAENGTSAGRAPTATYLSCSGIYCHSPGQSSTGGALAIGDTATVQWGDSAACGSCHETTTLASGSHNAHLTYTEMTIGCDQCHAGVVSDTSYPSTQHVDQTIDVAAAVNYDQGASHAPENGYGKCSTIYCHGDGTPTWGGNVSCGECHADDNTLPLSHDVHFDSTTFAADGTTAGYNSITGAYIFQCGTCHDNRPHIDGTLQVQLNAALVGGSFDTGNDQCASVYCHSDGYDGGVTYNTVTWGIAGEAACGTCHGNNDVAQPKSSSHAYHLRAYSETDDINKYAGYQYACSTCHASVVSPTADATVVPTITDKSLHVNAERNVSFNAFVNAGTAYNNGTKDCANLYCHSQGQDLTDYTGGNAPTRAPVWEGSIADGSGSNCDGCHGELAANLLTTNAHASHYNSAALVGYRARCSSCHQATMGFGTGMKIRHPENHADKNVNVKWDFDEADFQNSRGYIMKDSDNSTGPLYGGASAASTTPDGAVSPVGGAVGSCASVYCHSYGNLDGSSEVVDVGGGEFKTIAWDAGEVVDCADCHGDGTEAYPTYTSGGVAGTSANSHEAHVSTSSIGCNVCHESTTLSDGSNPATATLVVGGEHLNRVEDVSFNIATAGSATYNPAVGTKSCATTYCHGGTTPQWGGAALGCADCHNAGNSLANSHGSHYELAAATVTGASLTPGNSSDTSNYVFSCGVCHDSITHAGGPVLGEQAAEIEFAATLVNSATLGTPSYTKGADAGFVDNGFKYTKGQCANTYCHSDGDGGPATVATPVWGVHSLGSLCDGCHGGNIGADVVMSTGKHGAHINTSVMADALCESCHTVTVDNTDRAIAEKSYHVNRTKNVDIDANFDSDVDPANNFSSNECSNIYCHSDGKSTATPNYATAIDWDSGTTDCVSCHGGAGGSNGGDGTATTALTSSHTVHTGTNGTSQFAYTCDVCHVATADDNATIGTAANHVNKSRDVAVSSTKGGGDDAIDGNYVSATESCATTNCHGTGDVDVKWLTAEPVGQTTGDCSLCHGMAADSTDGRDTNGNTAANDAQVGAHVVHLNPSISAPIGCDECHLTTVTNQTAAGTYVAKVNVTGHIDTGGTAELTWGDLADGGDDGQAGAAPSSCATTYCHDGGAIKNAWDGGSLTPVWTDTNFIQGTVADCNNCHGYPPPATHPANSDCSVCHDVLQADDVTFTAAGKLTHVDGIVQASGGDSCSDCHAADVDGAGKDGVHGSHTNVTTFLSGKTISGGDYGTNGWYTTTWVNGAPMFGCGECHPAAEGTGHPIAGLNLDIDPAGETPTAGSPKLQNAAQSTPSFTSGSSVTCASVYCHSDGQSTLAYKTSPDWYGGAVSGNCNDCHANGPSSGTHSDHIVGIHYETLYDGANAQLAKSGTAGSGAAHGDPNTADTIGCQSCHNSTVKVEFNDQNSVCTTCHNSAPTFQGDMVIDTGGSTHVNGSPDVVFDSFSSFKSKAQIRDDITVVPELNSNWTRNNSYKAANSFDQGKVATPSFAGDTCSNTSCHNGITTPTWSGGSNMDCSACHTGLPQ